MTTDLSVVVPAYNEEARVAPTLRALDEFLAASRLRYEIVVVDDGSTDATIAVVEELATTRPAIRCIATAPNRGKGHAVRVGMLAARGEVRVMCDADGSMPATELPKIVNPVTTGDADVALGSRYVEGAAAAAPAPWYRRWWSRLANAVVRRALVGGVRDTQCGFKAFSAAAAEEVFRRASIDGWAFDLEALALAQRLGFGLTEVGVRWTDDRRSRVSPLRDAWNVVRELVEIRRNFRRGVYE